VLAVLARGALLVLLHLPQQGADVFVELPQPPQEVLLGFVHLVPRPRPLVLRQLVRTLLLDFVDATHPTDYLVVN
jgi:hypothetical protein